MCSKGWIRSSSFSKSWKNTQGQISGERRYSQENVQDWVKNANTDTVLPRWHWWAVSVRFCSRTKDSNSWKTESYCESTIHTCKRWECAETMGCCQKRTWLLTIFMISLSAPIPKPGTIKRPSRPLAQQPAAKPTPSSVDNDEAWLDDLLEQWIKKGCALVMVPWKRWCMLSFHEDPMKWTDGNRVILFPCIFWLHTDGLCSEFCASSISKVSQPKPKNVLALAQNLVEPQSISGTITDNDEEKEWIVLDWKRTMKNSDIDHVVIWCQMDL